MLWTTSQHQGEKWFESSAAVLGEVHDESIYRAIERLVQAAQQVGFSVPDLIRVLKSGMTLESLLDLIEIRMAGALSPTSSRAS